MGLDIYTQVNSKEQDFPDLQFENMWTFSIDDPENPLPHGDLLIKESSLPLWTLSYDKPEWELVLPKEKDKYSDLSITFYEDINFTGIAYFKDWLDLLYNFDLDQFTTGFHNNKRHATIKYISLQNTGLTVDAQGKSKTEMAIRTNAEFRLLWVLPKSINDLTLSSDSGDPLTFTVDLEFQLTRFNQPTFISGPTWVSH
jgi:hypothetical protein